MSSKLIDAAWWNHQSHPVKDEAARLAGLNGPRNYGFSWWSELSSQEQDALSQVEKQAAYDA